jgi:hypothetical protein
MHAGECARQLLCAHRRSTLIEQLHEPAEGDEFHRATHLALTRPPGKEGRPKADREPRDLDSAAPRDPPVSELVQHHERAHRQREPDQPRNRAH